MEGLIPFVIHAIKKSKQRNQYMSLSDESSHGRRGPWPDKEGSSRHRRTRSEFQQRQLQGSDYLHGPSDLQRRRGLAPSRCLRDGALPTAAASGATGATGGLW